MKIEFNENFERRVFADNGVAPDKLLCVFAADLDSEGDCADAYIGFTEKGLFVLEGDTVVTKVRGAKKLCSVFNLRAKYFYPLGSERLSIARNISTASLYFSGADGGKIIARFSLGLTARAERLANAFNSFAETGKVDKTLVGLVEPLCCPKCKRPYPDQSRKICPYCVDKRSITFRLLSHFKKYSKTMLLIGLLMLVSTAFTVLSPYIGTKLLFDEVLVAEGKWFGEIAKIVALIVGVRLLGLLINIVYPYILSGILPFIIYDIKVDIFSAMQRLSVGFYTSKHTGALMDRVNKDANHIYWFFVDGLPYLIVNIMLFAGVVAIMLSMSVKLALITIVTIPVILILFRLLWSVFRKLNHRNWMDEANMNSFLSDAVNGQRIIKAFAKESTENKRFKGYSTALADSQIVIDKVDFTAFPLIYLIMFAAQVVITAVGGIMVTRGEISLGTLLTFISYMSLLYGPLEFMSWVSNWWARCVDSAQRMFEIIDSRPDVVEVEHPAVLEDFRGNIDINGINFEYEPAHPIIRDLTLDVPENTMLGIVGKTGAGKSTLANLIARLYDVGSGSISIDGCDIRQLSLEQLRSNVGIVSQEIYLFIGSIADNIRYAKPNASMDEVIAAAKAASAHEFIIKLPDGYETRVGAGGQDLSGGERQRLSIARTVLQNPKILILDEATAAMDTKTERNIQEALSKLKLNRTTIAIAHRLSTLRDADMLCVIENGKVVEKGTHDQLFALKGEYYKQYIIQFEAYKFVGIGE